MRATSLILTGPDQPRPTGGLSRHGTRSVHLSPKHITWTNSRGLDSDIYAGGYIDPHTGKLHIGFTQVTDFLTEELLSEFAYPDDIEDFLADNTLQDLQDTADSIILDRDSGSLATDGLNVGTVTVNEETNAIDVTTYDPSTASAEQHEPDSGDVADAQAELATTYGAVTNAVAGADNQLTGRWEAGAKITTDPYGKITGQPYAECTAGFGAHYRGSSYQLTAGHCAIGGFYDWSTWVSAGGVGRWEEHKAVRSTMTYHGGTFNADAMLIKVGRRDRTARMRVVSDSRPHSYTVSGARSVSTSDRVCFYGAAKNAANCGVVTSLNGTYTLNEAGHDYKFTNLIELKIDCDEAAPIVQGDSGGPAYVVTQSNRTASAVGLIQAVAGDECGWSGKFKAYLSSLPVDIAALGGRVQINYG